MNAADLVIAIVLLVGFLIGLSRGFVRGLLGLAGLGLGIILAASFHEQVAETVFTFVPGEAASKIVAFVVIFLAIVILVGLVARLIAKAMKLSSLGWFDGLLGGLLGLAIAVIVSGVLLLLAVMAGLQEENFLIESRLAPKVLGGTDAIVGLLPDDTRQVIEEQYEELRTEWDRAAKRRRPSEGQTDEEARDEGATGEGV
jgi:membrane protein required for colicin V production